ncbi:hypothetical protein K491DRAFT_696234 [Lophiostoma macrostomum CBS 122681]|uniref:Ubiquitin-like domain-containing protein n=1 Tax=Lophiostoma macrostomum CBS 122681 TaxID=1314788 RepID=A0A6A6SVK8_9PLEO|nr:hypothetical protein K491DRAFT_696234 [Lophiostoma macrostomum CBS 122681]
MSDDAPAIDLKVLSPSTEVGRDIHLPQISASTTVADLRLRLKDAIASRPSIERMRLIYRGRVVANDTDTLSDVFGAENIRQYKDHTLHLVLRELPPPGSVSSSSPVPRSTTAPPNSSRGPAPSPQTNPFRPSPQAQPRPTSQPQAPPLHPHAHAHAQHHHHQHQGAPHQHFPPPPANPFQPMQLPPALNNLVQQQFAQAMAQNYAQNAPGAPQNQPPRDGSPAPAAGEQPAPASGQPAAAQNLASVPNSTRTVRHETIGPNGERWTMTINNTSVTIPAAPGQQPILPRPFPHPPGYPLPARRSPAPPDATDHLGRLRAAILAARAEMDNIRALMQRPDNPAAPYALAELPAWRGDRIRLHVQNMRSYLDQVQSGLTSVIIDPAMAQRPDVVSLQQYANTLRSQADNLNLTLESLRDRNNRATAQQPVQSGHSSVVGDPTIAQGQSGTAQQPTTEGTWPPPALSPLPQGLPDPPTRPLQDNQQPSATPSAPELFILSSPQGPVGVLFDQRGTYSTAPMAPTLPFQAFTQQFSANRQILAGIGQQMAQNTAHLQNQIVGGQYYNNHAQPQAPINQAAGHDQNQPQPQNQNQIQVNANPAQPQAQAQIPPEALGEPNDPLAQFANHAWRFIQIACFFWIFAGHGNWSRPLMLAGIMALVYVAQLRMFEDHRRRIRQHFEALLPINEERNANRAAANAAPRGDAGEGAGDGARGGGGGRPGDITPEQAARRLVQQHLDQRRGWIRQGVRSVERAFALFVASLWPGVGERMVQAQEERVREERRIEEERERVVREEEEREKRRVEEEQAGQQEDQSGKDEGGATGRGVEGEGVGKSKGKEKEMEKESVGRETQGGADTSSSASS